MIGVSIQITGADAVEARFKRAALFLPPRVNAVTRTYGHLTVRRVQMFASGRPGPNAPTGRYRSRWRVDFFRDGLYVSAAVSNDSPQRDRLEFGFNGIDSLGRHYNQPPYPHIGPAADSIEPEYYAAMQAVTVGM